MPLSGFLLLSAFCFQLCICFGDEIRRDATSERVVVGWTPQPNSRGSLDIIITCLATVFLCTWYCLCPNIPAENDPPWVALQDKLSMCFLALLGPEFTLWLAMGEWHSARESVREFGKTHPQWTMHHAFFADMGGFVLQSPDFPRFPVDAKQLHYLVSRGFVEFPTITEAEIKDKNKVNFLARLVALGQVVWFTINCIARGIQNIGLTLGEVTTLGFVSCTMATSYFWRHKPADVECPVIIQTNTRVADILKQSGDDMKLQYRNTPLDFISRDEWTVSKHWQYWRRCLAGLRLESLFFRVRKSRPLQRIPDDRLLTLPEPWTVLYAALSFTYICSSLIAWNFDFPTPLERLLWRVFSIVHVASSCCALVTLWFLNYGRQKLENKEANLDSGRQEVQSQSKKSFLERVRCFRTNGDMMLRIDLIELIPYTILASIYVVSRAYIIVEDWICLRALPPKMYQTVEWTNFIHHA